MGNIRGGMIGFHGTIGQPTAQVIDGSLKFNGVNQHLTRTFSSGGNRRTFTLSYWISRCHCLLRLDHGFISFVLLLHLL